MTTMTSDGTNREPVTTARTTRTETVSVSAPVGARQGAGSAEARPDGWPARPRRRGASARLRIMGWLVLVLATALVSVVLVTRNVLINALEREIGAALSQEVEEFRQFTQEGRNPETGQPFAAAAELLQVHLERQSTGESEVIAGIWGVGEEAVTGRKRAEVPARSRVEGERLVACWADHGEVASVEGGDVVVAGPFRDCQD